MGKVIIKNFWEYVKKVVLIWVGFCFLVIGLIGLIFPILPGFLFLLPGLLLVAKGSDSFRDHHYIKRLFVYIKLKLNKQSGLFKRLAALF